MEDYGRWSYKIVYYVYYNDEEKRYPVFCVEPAKQGVGTGYDSYTAIINKVEDMYSNGDEKKNQIWRILNKGYMGSSWNSWNLECDDDFYSATKIALHSLAEGVSPDEKYVLGNRSVDGNSVEDIQRRGEKVLNVAQNLYDYGLNGKEKYENPKVSITEKGEPLKENINNVEYYVQNYVISSNKDLKSYEISIKNFPKETILLNSKNEEISNDKNIKVAIPIKNIKEDIKGTIYIKNANIKTNPIFYCESTEDEAQSYVTYNNLYEIANDEIEFELKANTANVLVRKADRETDEPLSNVKFELLDENKNKISEVTTNEKGEGIFQNLYPRKVYIKEVQAPDGYIINSELKEINLEYDKTSEVKFTNEKQKGKLQITKEDSENEKIKLENVEFEVKDSENKLVEKIKTNKEGVAITSNLPIGKYKVREIATNKDYILSDIESEINVEYNRTSNIVITNEEKKGKVKVVKADKDNNSIKLEGVEFEIIDVDNNVLEKIITNENGEAVSKDYCIRDYKKIKIREVKTLEEYLLSTEIKEVELKENVIQEVKFENEKKKEPEKEVLKLPRTGF